MSLRAVAQRQLGEVQYLHGVKNRAAVAAQEHEIALERQGLEFNLQCAHVQGPRAERGHGDYLEGNGARSFEFQRQCVQGQGHEHDVQLDRTRTVDMERHELKDRGLDQRERALREAELKLTIERERAIIRERAVEQRERELELERRERELDSRSRILERDRDSDRETAQGLRLAVNFEPCNQRVDCALGLTRDRAANLTGVAEPSANGPSARNVDSVIPPVPGCGVDPGQSLGGLGGPAPCEHVRCVTMPVAPRDRPGRAYNDPETEGEAGSTAITAAAVAALENRRLKQELEGLRVLAQWQQGEVSAAIAWSGDGVQWQRESGYRDEEGMATVCSDEYDAAVQEDATETAGTFAAPNVSVDGAFEAGGGSTMAAPALAPALPAADDSSMSGAQLVQPVHHNTPPILRGTPVEEEGTSVRLRPHSSGAPPSAAGAGPAVGTTSSGAELFAPLQPLPESGRTVNVMMSRVSDTSHDIATIDRALGSGSGAGNDEGSATPASRSSRASSHGGVGRAGGRASTALAAATAVSTQPMVHQPYAGTCQPRPLVLW